MKFRRDLAFCTYCGIPVASGAAAAPGSGAQVPQSGTAAPALPRTQYPVRGRCRLSRSQRAPRITAAAHPKVSPGRNPTRQEATTYARATQEAARSSSPSSRPSSSWRSSSAALPHSSYLHGKKNAAAGPVQTSDTTDATPKKTQKQSPTQIEGKKAVSEVTMTNFVCNYDTSDWGWDGGAWFPT